MWLHISLSLGAFRGIFWGCVPSFDNSAWNTLNSINYMHLHRFFRGVFQVKAKSQLGIGNFYIYAHICWAHNGIYMCVYILIYYYYYFLGTLGTHWKVSRHRAGRVCSSILKFTWNTLEHIRAKDLTIQHVCALRVFQAVRSALIMRQHFACSMTRQISD